MLRIALISEPVSPLTPATGARSGSQALYVAQIARRLSESGHSVDIYTRRDAPHLPPQIEWFPNLRIFHVPAGPERRLAAAERESAARAFGEQLLRAFGERRYDVVHASCVTSCLSAREAAQVHDIPLVVTYRGRGLRRRDGGGHRVLTPLLRQPQPASVSEALQDAARLVAFCESDRQLLVSRHGVAPERVDVVPCGFDPQDLPPMTRAHARHALGWDPEAYNLLQIGRHAPRHGGDVLVRALARLRDQHGVEARLYMVGGGSEADVARLRALIAGHALEDRVQLLGRCGRESLSYLYHAADVFVTMPRSAHSGIAAIEAMACGIPVVGPAVGSLGSVVVDGATGCCVPPDNPMALAAALARLAERPGLRHAYGRAARRQVRTTYTWRQLTREIFACYRRAMNAGVSAAPQTRPAAEAMPLLQATG